MLQHKDHEKLKQTLAYFNIALILIIILVFLIVLITQRRTIFASVNNVTIQLEVARTEEERNQGLMSRNQLPDMSGMLFIYTQDSSNSYWMKDCLISLDIIFLSSSKRVVDIKKGFEPCRLSDSTKCPTYTPQMNYRYVIEVNSGFTSRNNINVGDLFTFEP